MKILFLTRLYWPHAGGVEKHIEKVIKRLRDKDIKIKIITTKYKNSLASSEKRDGVEIIRFTQPKAKYLGLVYTWLWMMKNIGLIYKSDVVHCHDVFIWYLPFRFLFPRKPVYTTFHGWEGKYPIQSKNIIQKQIAAKLSSKTIAVGRFIGKYYKIKPNIVIYGAVDAPKSIVKKENKRIVYLGRLEKDTGLLTILESLKRYRRIDDGSKTSVEFLGDGIMRKECEKYGKVRGFVDPAPYMSKASICFASGYLSILEGLAHKCFVITAYDNLLKKDYFKLTPFYNCIISSDSASNIAKTIKNYSKNETKYQKMINGGYNWVKIQTWERLVDQYLDLWLTQNK